MKHISHWTVPALLLLVAACSGDSSVAPATQPADLTQVFSRMSSAGQYGLLAGAASGTQLSSFLLDVPSGCAYAAASQSFVCPSRTVSGITYTSSYVLRDAGSHTQSAFDAKTTASVQLTASATGTTTTALGTLATTEQQSMTVSGLLTGATILNGVTTLTESGSIVIADGVPQTFTATMKQTMTNLVEPTGTSATLPSSGSIAIDLTSGYASFGGLVTAHTDVVFTGTSKLTITTVVGGVTQRCTVDTASPYTRTCA